MAVRATELRKGTVIVGQQGELLVITEFHHHTPGNLRAIIHIKVKNIETGAVAPMRLSSSDTFETAYLDRRRCEYLYQDSTGYVFMDQENFEQFPLPESMVADAMGYVRENTVVDITFHGTEAVGIDLPASVVLEVKEAEPAVRGNTATNVKKDAVLETGLKIKVPLHIQPGDRVRVTTADGLFQGRENA